MGQQDFDRKQLQAAYDAFNAAFEREADKSGAYGLRGVFKEEGADLIEAAVGHPKWLELREAVSRQDRGAIGVLVNCMLDRSAA
ncbi:MAG: hypothetical protein UY72_C0023G0006 [Candidatus Uhrbacteria bacterium GW2011_GWD2_52_7]|uniref:Uncharacterized protein n=1 Tax=Candidatus Uhrbacteria bacterium GW2011_GWD2_52_7 TaxID=1618989 RepID=A0A0G2ACE0_9BACT|nr:MAG: hypothetical protein UY72_C0023G0006 [Candidatus Uhrbacteria bacterium GW2011_GWD2_52_7]